MYIKSSFVALTLFQVVSLVSAASSTTKKSTKTASSKATTLSKPQDYYKTFDTTIDPLNITIPQISQVTSLDPTQECSYYEATNFKYDDSEWPNLWETATSNGMAHTAEFKALYNSINWTAMPDIPVRKGNSDGSIDMGSYDEDKDPDCWWSASTCTTPKHDNINADISACPEPETWGLTYDDGPNCSHNAFYDYLEEQNIKASMFYIGSNVVNWPYGAQRGQKAGHHIADHTWSHQLMTTLNNTEVLAELYYTQKAIKVVTGVTPLYWRPAFGDVDDRVRWIATQLNLTTILWNLDTDDWAAGESETLEDVQKTYEDFIEMGQNGTWSKSGQITLTHEIDNTTMSLALEYLPKMRSAYKHVVDVATCMNITQPYQETQVVFNTFEQYLASNGSVNNNDYSNLPLCSALLASSSAVEQATSVFTSAAAAATSSVNALADSQAVTNAGLQVTPNKLALAVVAIAFALF